MSTIADIVEFALHRIATEAHAGKVDLKTIIYSAVNQGMADAFDRGFNHGKAAGIAEIKQRDQT